MTRSLVFLLCGFIAFSPAVGQTPPGPPANNSPMDGAVDVEANPLLCVDADDPQAEPLNATFFGRDLTTQPGEDFTIVVLPDTQYYSQIFPEIFVAQTQWIVDNTEALNIVFVTHVGDVVQIASNPWEWVNADAAMGLLENPVTTRLPEGIPYGISVGNHDQTPNNTAGSPLDDDETTASFNQFFGLSRFQGRSYFGGSFGSANDSNYQLFSAAGMDFIIFHHEFDDTYNTILPEVLDWTDTLLKTTYRDRRALVTAHSLLCTETSCPSSLFAEFSNQGQATYDALKDNPNLFLMICGHAGASEFQPRRSDAYDGNTIHTFLADYQRGEDCPFRCGNGWLRIMTFSPANDEIQVTTYSPWLNKVWDGPNPDHHGFTLSYDMQQGIPFTEIGSSYNVPSGTAACLTWPGHQDGATYEWFVEVSNTTGTTTGPVWTFTSDGTCALAPDCDDGDDCTFDSCVASTCSRSAVPNCCESNSDCDDGNQCTTDSCISNQCSYTNNTAPCNDGDSCTEAETCLNGVCSGSVIDCDDGNACTADTCMGGACDNTYTPTAGCCLVDSDCADDLTCSVDSCNLNGDCTHAPDATCCTADDQCVDADACTWDRCLEANHAALLLDGINDHVAMGVPDGLGLPTGLNAETFTIECWFNWDGAGATAATSGWIFDSGDVGGINAIPLVAKGMVDAELGTPERNVNYFLGILESGVLAGDFEEASTGSSPGTNHPVVGTTPISLNEWHHAAAVYDGSCWQLYLDGIPETDGSNCPMEPAGFESIHIASIGTAQNHTGELQGRFSGLVDEVRIWDRPLSGAEILDLMFLHVDSHPDLMGSWSFDDASGIIVPDATGNNHVGVIHVGAFESPQMVSSGVVATGDNTCGNLLLPPAVCDPGCALDLDGDGIQFCLDTCVDTDGDAYGDRGVTGDTCAGPDCDSGDSRCNTDCATDVDADLIPDCRDECLDIDGDGYGQPGGVCSVDCDDMVPTCSTDCVTDVDGDGIPICADTCVDADADGYGDPGGAGDDCLGADCDPGNPGCSTNCQDMDSDSFCVPADCDESDADRFPGAPEVNDCLDDQCPGDLGYGVSDETSGDSGFHNPSDRNEYSWSPQAGATLYEVARSDAADGSSGDCTVVTIPDTFWLDSEEPPPGGAFYYLNRPLLPCLGSWGQDSSKLKRTYACGTELACGDAVDNDGDGLSDCLDPDCQGAPPCGAPVFSFQDTPGDDVSPTALFDFFSSVIAGPGDYLFFEIVEGPGRTVAWCTERADLYRDQYLTSAGTTGTADSGSWQKWSKSPSTSGGWLLDSAPHPNDYGAACFEAYSWCSEDFGSEPRNTVRPGGPDDCEAYDPSAAGAGCGGGTWVLTIRIAGTRLDACGF